MWIETFGAANFAKFVRGEMPAPAHGVGGWFVFGAEKVGERDPQVL